VTGSDDGLISCIDLTVADPEECLKSVLNVEQPVAKMGFFGPSGQFIYSISTVETLSLWSIKQATRISTWQDIRADLSRAAGTPVHYLVTCHYDYQSERLFLVAGDNGGGVILAHLLRDQVQPFCLVNTGNAVAAPLEDEAEENYDGTANLTNEHPTSMEEEEDEEGEDGDLQAMLASSSAAANIDDESDGEADDGEEAKRVLSGGTTAGGIVPAAVNGLPEAHTEVVRAAVWMGPYIITGGHDSKLCVWTSLPPTQEEKEAAASIYKMKSSHQARVAQRSKGSSKKAGSAGAAPY